MTAVINNLGNSSASNIRVRLYDGDPDAGGVQVGGDKIIPSLGIRYSAPATLAWDYNLPAGRTRATLYVRVDPDNAIADSNRANNTASYTITVYDVRIMLPLIVSNRP